MPIYDYYSEETGESKEVFHSMFATPEVKDSKGNLMKRIIIKGHGGYRIKSGTTRNLHKRKSEFS